jgi:hypothetical protein
MTKKHLRLEFKKETGKYPPTIWGIGVIEETDKSKMIELQEYIEWLEELLITEENISKFFNTINNGKVKL